MCIFIRNIMIVNYICNIIIYLNICNNEVFLKYILIYIYIILYIELNNKFLECEDYGFLSLLWNYICIFLCIYNKLDCKCLIVYKKERFNIDLR